MDRDLTFFEHKCLYMCKLEKQTHVIHVETNTALSKKR